MSRKLARLKQALMATRAGRGRTALVLGEPEIGKSRLGRGACRASPREIPDLGWAEGRCLSYGQPLPYHPLLDLVGQVLGIPPGTDPARLVVLGRE